VITGLKASIAARGVGGLLQIFHLHAPPADLWPKRSLYREAAEQLDKCFLHPETKI